MKWPSLFLIHWIGYTTIRDDIVSNESDRHGRAFEFACISVLNEEISKKCRTRVIIDSCYFQRQEAWSSFSDQERNAFVFAAKAAVPVLFDMEPMILEDCEDGIQLFFLKDSEGESGDVRDIVLKRPDVKWEIGFSIKHNHFAVKHSRLSPKIDFCDKWFGIYCSDDYWSTIKPIFDYLQNEKKKGSCWSDLPDKSGDVYLPLLKAFMDEIERQYELNGPVVPKKMVEYLLGEFDFYKLISIETKRITEVKTFNLHGTLNRPSSTCRPKIIVPAASLPDEIIRLRMKPGSDTTAELILNNGWSFSFRIHNASTKVEPSLKFDIQFIGVPPTILSFNCVWT